MVFNRFRFFCMALLLLTASLSAEAYWKTLFAYNNVEQIAMTNDKVFAISDGALYSVDKLTERIETYNAGNGLHGSNIVRIYYDKVYDMLLIAYADGKLDVLHNGTIEYVSGLYTKDMLATKTINNITVYNGRAYLAMDFGIVTFRLNKRELVDTYYIGTDATEVKVEDIVFQDDSIYAFVGKTMYKAALRDNLPDYRCWQTENVGRIARDMQKGVRYTDDSGEIWMTGGAEGIVRVDAIGNRNAYKPQGPLTNTPYDMTATQGHLYVVSGGRWAVQYNTPGNVMVYDGTQWINISQSAIQAQTGNPAKDFMHVAVDPKDAMHYFVTGYGTGVFEFRGSELVQQYLPNNSSLMTAVEHNPKNYTRTSGGMYDKAGNLWLMNSNTATNQLQCRSTNGVWKGVTVTLGNRDPYYDTTGDLILDNRNQNHKWFLLPRKGSGLVLVDDKGTLDAADDRSIFRSVLHKADGTEIDLSTLPLYKCFQDDDNNIWLGTRDGVIVIPNTVDFFASDLCLRIDIQEDNGEKPFLSNEVYAIDNDDKGRIWIGTTTMGVYVLSADRQTIESHYTTDNSPMPSNYVMSLAWDDVNDVMYIGTSKGIVSYSEQSTDLRDDISADTAEPDYGSMQQWKLHYSYAKMEEVAYSATEVYGLANGALFSLNKQDETISLWNKSTGLNSSDILHIAYDNTTKQLIICYADGRIDLLSADGSVTQMPDLYQKAATIPVTVNDVFVADGCTYLAMPFGIVSINTKKAEVIDTYYIGDSAQSVNVQRLAVLGDTLYALSPETLYAASIGDNLVDYSFWKPQSLPNNRIVSDIQIANDALYALQDSVLYISKNGSWNRVENVPSLNWIIGHANRLLANQKRVGSIIEIGKDEIHNLGSYGITDIQYDASCDCYWMAAPNYGIARVNGNKELRTFPPDGPANNIGYRLKYTGDQIFVAGGGRWAVESKQDGTFSIYNGTNWRKISSGTTRNQLGLYGYPRDLVSICADPNDSKHFFVALYGMGVIEYRNDAAVAHYGVNNSSLRAAAENNPNYYTRTEGLMIDEAGNLWVLNTGQNAYPVNIMTPQGKWYGLDMYSNGHAIRFETPWEITVDNRDSHRKWMIDQRKQTGVILLDDGGTPTSGNDDKCLKRNIFVDGDNIQLMPEFIYCLAQDMNGDIWLGTPSGIIVIPSTVDFFTSNQCTRIKIPRNDGTNLADYLLGTEQINAIVVDGANRKWIGTETSGIYLMSADGLTTIAHFTTENSVLPSNSILSIAINSNTGEVFVGTGKGIASYKSDASTSQEDFSGAYAYPNPVRPNYEGMITITGLMENTTVNIVDAGGNLVCKTKSNGGTAVWDGKNFRGQRVGSGVYTALCNAEGKNHTVVKILVMN